MIEGPIQEPLKLIWNKHRISPVIQPLNLVVTEDMARMLAARVQCNFGKVVVTAVADIGYLEGSMEHWNVPGYCDDGISPERILRAVAQPPAEELPTLLEVIPHDGEILAERALEEGFNKVVVFSKTKDTATLVGTRRALADYGLIWSDGVHCFSEKAFEGLTPYFHPDYFEIQVVTV